MNTIIFDLDFNRWDVILMSLFPAFINAGIFIYVLYFLQKSLTNYIFSLFVFLAAFCQLSDGFVRMSITPETAMEWLRISQAFYLFVIAFGILFTLSISKSLKLISNRYIFLALFFPPIVLLTAIIARLDRYIIIRSDVWHWVVNPYPNMATSLIYLWLSGGAILMLGLLWYNYFIAKGDLKKRSQLLVLASCFTIPVVGGIIAEIIIPLFLGMNDIPITTSFFTTFSVGSLVAIKKYRLFEFSPKHKWDQIVESMNEGIIIVDNDDRIMFANKMFSDLLGYSEHEINGKIAYELFLDPGEKSRIKKVIAERKENVSTKYEIQLNTKSGEPVWVMISGAPYTDASSNVIGSIGIVTNINSQKKVEALFRALVENVEDIIALTDKEGKIVYVSPAIEKVTGYTPEEIKGKPSTFLMHPEFIEESNQILKELLLYPGVSIPRINRFKHKNGHYVWVEGMVTNFLLDPNIQAIVTNYRDITQRKEALEKIRESEENLNAIFENTSEGFIVTDLEGIIKYFNQAAKDTILKNIEKEPTRGLSVFNYIDADRKDFFASIISKVSLGETIQYDRSYLRKNGSEIWLDFTINPVRDDEGITGICITGKDITDRKASEEVRALIMSSALDAIICIDENGLITLWNPSAEKIFGWKEVEMIGKRISNTIIPLKYRQRHEDGFKLYKETKDFRILNKVIEISAIHKNKKEFPIELSIIPIKQNGIEFFCAFIRDISERKEAEEKLRNNEERLRIIVDNEPECVKIVDLEGALLEMNPAGLLILGVHSIKEVIGKKIINFVHDDDKKVYANLHELVCKGGSGTADYRMVSRDGGHKWMESNSVPLKNANGEIYAVLSVARDITEIKKSQEQLIINEKRYRALVENGADAVVILSTRSKALYVSSSIEHVLEYTEKEALEGDFLSLVFPDDLLTIKGVLSKAESNPGMSIPGITGRLKHKDGSWHWYEATVINMIDDLSIGGIIVNFRDITLRKESEDRIRESETNLKAIFENTSEGFFLIDSNNILKAFNKKANDIITFNHRVHNELRAGENFFNFIEENRHDFFRNALVKVMAGETVVYNRSYTRSNGHVVWLNYSINPVFSEVGINRYCITAHDITALKEAQLQKEFDNNNLNALINNTHDLMWSIDVNYCLITSNKAYDDQHKFFTGRFPVQGQSVIVETGDDTVHRWKSYYNRALNGETFIITEHIVLEEEWWTQISFYPIKKGNMVVGTACYGHNITERKNTEKILQKNTDELIAVKNDLEHSELRLKQAQAIAHVGNWEVNFETGSVIWSDETYRIFGLEIGKDIPTYDSWLSFVHHEDVHYVNEVMIESQRTFSNSSFYNRIVRTDGEVRNILTESRYEFNREGKAIGVYDVVHDVTDEKLAEEKLVELNDKLVKRAQELAVSNDELEKFAYIASHDLQEPLRMVTGFLTQLGSKYNSQLDDKAREYIYYATDGAVRMRQIILDLLEYSRVGRKELAFEYMDMNEVVRQAVQLNKLLVEEKDALIKWNNLPFIRGGKNLHQVVQNLIANALKYQHDGSRPVINISANETPLHWEFKFTDNGIGIEERFFDKIFVVFQRLHNRDKYSGTGIGLAICKKIIENHGGTIGVYSVAEEGSTFYFTIPKNL